MIRRVSVRLSTNRVATQARKWSEKKIQDQGKVREFYFDTADLIPSLASKGEHVMSKHALINCQTWHDWSSNV